MKNNDSDLMGKEGGGRQHSEVLLFFEEEKF